MIEILPGRLYFECGSKSPRDKKECFYFTTDNNTDFHYEKFYKDFGPLNVAVLYKFCVMLQEKLKLISLSKKRLIYYVNSRDEEKRSNAAYLIGSFSILYLHIAAEDVCKLFCKSDERPFLPFRDAAPGDSTYGLRLIDVFRAIEKANNLKWIDFENFDLNEYEHLEKVENGDLNWIIPGKILAFCGPHLKSTDEDGYPRHSPETYFDYFKNHNVTNVVRLNRKVYESSRFTEAGFRHDDLFFVDGSTPSNAIVLKFIKLIEEASGAVAVHCKAGLGRTGTLIACYMMKHYGFTAPECMSWIRICRPGSIIGPQQQFLIHVQNWCRSLPGSNYRTHSPENILHLPKSHRAIVPDLSQSVDRIKPTKEMESSDGNTPSENYDSKRQALKTKKAPGSFYRSKTMRPYRQGEHLMRIKGSRQTHSCRTTTKSKFRSDATTVMHPQVHSEQIFGSSPGISRRKVPTKSSEISFVEVVDSSSPSKFVEIVPGSRRSSPGRLSNRSSNKQKSTDNLDESLIGESKKDKSERYYITKSYKKGSLSDSVTKRSDQKIVSLQNESKKAHTCKVHQCVEPTSPAPIPSEKTRPGHHVKYSLRRLPIRLRPNIDYREKHLISRIDRPEMKGIYSNNEALNPLPLKGIKPK